MVLLGGEVEPLPWPARIVARAFDSGGGAQPASAGEVWSFLGYANNAWHGVDIEVWGLSRG